jgi:hypothetical protein
MTQDKQINQGGRRNEQLGSISIDARVGKGKKNRPQKERRKQQKH